MPDPVSQQLDAADVIVPLFTPLTPGGDVDENATTRLVAHVVDAGVEGVFVLGSSGEGHSLPIGDQYRIASLVAGDAQGRVPLYLGLLQAGTRPMVEFAGGCAVLDKFQAVVVGVPYYRFLTCPDEVVEHFRFVHQALGKPVIVYHLPHPASTESPLLGSRDR